MRIFMTGLLLVAVSLLASCSWMLPDNTRRGVSSSLVDYLYPEGTVPPKHQETTPNLHLPLTVGLAFVPAQNQSRYALPEAKKSLLLEEVKKQFVGLDYVRDITVIPETYMRSSKGFDGVGQIARLYGLDVIALVSYDQVAMTAETKKSILYWTIVGAYFVKGNENTATTFVDTAIFDVNSRKMLFRAPGVSELKTSTTLVEINQNYQKTREKGFELAMQDMSKNLAIELDSFKERIKQDKSVTITRSPGYGGGGAVEWPWLLLALGLALTRFVRK